MNGMELGRATSAGLQVGLSGVELQACRSQQPVAMLGTRTRMLVSVECNSLSNIERIYLWLIPYINLNVRFSGLSNVSFKLKIGLSSDWIQVLCEYFSSSGPCKKEKKRWGCKVKALPSNKVRPLTAQKFQIFIHL